LALSCGKIFSRLDTLAFEIKLLVDENKMFHAFCGGLAVKKEL